MARRTDYERTRRREPIWGRIVLRMPLFVWLLWTTGITADFTGTITPQVCKRTTVAHPLQPIYLMEDSFTLLPCVSVVRGCH